jgi:hypothetical protein
MSLTSSLFVWHPVKRRALGGFGGTTGENVWIRAYPAKSRRTRLPG